MKKIPKSISLFFYTIIIAIIYCAIGFILFKSLGSEFGPKGPLLLKVIALASPIIVLYTALELFSLKKNKETVAIYGALEICMGLMSITFRFFIKDNGDFINILAIYTSLYIIVRGLENMSKFYAEKSSDFLQKLLEKERILTRLCIKFIKDLENTRA